MWSAPPAAVSHPRLYSQNDTIRHNMAQEDKSPGPLLSHSLSEPSFQGGGPCHALVRFGPCAMASGTPAVVVVAIAGGGSAAAGGSAAGGVSTAAAGGASSSRGTTASCGAALAAGQRG
eukprot:1713615-Prymnesium_polylepis.1